MSALPSFARPTRRRGSMRSVNRDARPIVRPACVPILPQVSVERPDLDDGCPPELWAPRSLAIPSFGIDDESGAIREFAFGDVLDSVYLSDGLSHI